MVPAICIYIVAMHYIFVHWQLHMFPTVCIYNIHLQYVYVFTDSFIYFQLYVFIIYICSTLCVKIMYSYMYFFNMQDVYFLCHMVYLILKWCILERFFENPKEAYGERKHMCVVSDCNASIIKIGGGVYNDVPHYACM